MGLGIIGKFTVGPFVGDTYAHCKILAVKPASTLGNYIYTTECLECGHVKDRRRDRLRVRHNVGSVHCTNCSGKASAKRMAKKKSAVKVDVNGFAAPGRLAMKRALVRSSAWGVR